MDVLGVAVTKAWARDEYTRFFFRYPQFEQGKVECVKWQPQGSIPSKHLSRPLDVHQTRSLSLFHRKAVACVQNAVSVLCAGIGYSQPRSLSPFVTAL